MKQSFTLGHNECTYVITERVKSIREVQLDLLKTLKEICLAHDLRYYLWGDTLKGAMFYGGFQLYDDNISVIMPRKDFESFQEIFRLEMGYPYKVCTNENNQGLFRNTSIRLINANTTGVELSALGKEDNWGIWINIFCLDYVFKKKKKRRRQLRMIGIMSRLCAMKSSEEKEEVLNDFSYLKKIIYYIIIKICRLKTLLKIYKKVCTSCEELRGGITQIFQQSI